MSKKIIWIYSDIHSCNFVDTNIFGHSFVSKFSQMSHSVTVIIGLVINFLAFVSPLLSFRDTLSYVVRTLIIKMCLCRNESTCQGSGGNEGPRALGEVCGILGTGQAPPPPSPVNSWKLRTTYKFKHECKTALTLMSHFGLVTKWSNSAKADL